MYLVYLVTIFPPRSPRAQIPVLISIVSQGTRCQKSRHPDSSCKTLAPINRCNDKYFHLLQRPN